MKSPETIELAESGNPVGERKHEDAAAVAESFYDDAYSRRFQRDAYASTMRLRRAFLFEPYITAGDRILDFGCGTGDLLDLLPAREKFGVDISPHFRELAGRKGIRVYSDLSELIGTSFDKIISAHALEHLVDPAAKLLQMAELLSESGQLILVLPMDEWGARRNRKWSPSDPDRHLYTWTPLLIGNLLQVCGFEPLVCRAVHHYHPPKGLGGVLARTPSLYHIAARISSHICRRRQLLAVARLNATRDPGSVGR